jgi:transposase
VKVCTREINAAKFVLRSAGLQGEASSLTTWGAWQKLLRCPTVEGVREHLAMHADVWRAAQEKVVVLEKELREALKPFQETMKRLQTAPGVVTITAATYIAVLATPDRFPDSARVASYIGLVPSAYDTGGGTSVTGASRNGAPRNCGRCCAKPHNTAPASDIP